MSRRDWALALMRHLVGGAGVRAALAIAGPGRLSLDARRGAAPDR